MDMIWGHLREKLLMLSDLALFLLTIPRSNAAEESSDGETLFSLTSSISLCLETGQIMKSLVNVTTGSSLTLSDCRI